MSAKRVLFLGHGAERTGPPIMLGHLLAGLAEHGRYDLSVVVARSGPLVDSYRSAGADVRAVGSGREPLELLSAGLRRAGAEGLAARAQKARRRRVANRAPEPDLVYVNGATPPTAALLIALDPPPTTPVVLHVHELDVGLRLNLDAADRRALLGRADRIVAASDAVAALLVDGHGVDAGRLVTCAEFVDRAALAPLPRATARAALGIPQDAGVVGSVGLPDWRKDPEHLLRAVESIPAATEPQGGPRRGGADLSLPWVVWIGGDPDSVDGRHLADEARRLGIDERFRHIAHADRPDRWLSALDVFALPAREDALPLAALEAAAVGCPLVCFRTGGVASLCDAGAGTAVDYPDTRAFATALHDLLADPVRRRAAGERAAELIAAMHDRPVGVARVEAVIDAELDRGGPPRAAAPALSALRALDAPATSAHPDPDSSAARPLRVTWLAHGAERTGPPIYLLRILEGLRPRHRIEASVVLLEGGPLLQAFEAVVPTTVVSGPVLSGLARGAASGLSRIGADRAARAVVSGLGRPAPGRPPDVVVVNTAGSIRALDALDSPPRRLVSHVHELATGLDYWLAPEWRKRVLEQSDEIWVVADAVGRHLVDRYGIDPASLRTHRGVLPDGALDPMPAEAREARRRSLGVRPDDVLVGASGTLDWRKAPDLFIETARQAVGLAEGSLRFVWIGGDDSGPWGRHLRTAAASAGLGERVRLVTEHDRPDRWFGALDLFLLPSREDAYPLVCLEAAAAGVPIVMFDSGGGPELLTGGGGSVVAYPDTRALAEALATLADDPELRAAQGRAARTAAGRHTVAAAVDSLVEDLRRVAGRPSGTEQ